MVCLDDVKKVVFEENIPNKLIKIIEELNTVNKTHTVVRRKLSEVISIVTDVKQGVSLRPLLFATIVD